jgi:protein-disulfide isomerase-like protein with CxxC motif
VVLLIREVDCSDPDPETEDIMAQYSIVGFPTVKLTYNGEITELRQKPTYDNLVSFVNSSL